MLNKPIIVNCPPYNDQSGGTIVLHYLVHRLRKMGVEAYAFPILKPVPKNHSRLRRYIRKVSTIRRFTKGLRQFQTHHALDTPLPSSEAIRKGIAVYPEIVSGNPLGSANVVRWILYKPRAFGSGEYFIAPNKDEEVFYFQMPFIADIGWIPPANHLRLQWLREDIFFDPGAVERTTICKMVRKGNTQASCNTNVPELAIELDGKCNEEIAEIFKCSKFFYCYDLYTMYCEYAALCGCVPIVIPQTGISLYDWRPENDRYGIAYGDSAEQLEWAHQTREELFNRLHELKSDEDTMLKNFVYRLSEKFCS